MIQKKNILKKAQIYIVSILVMLCLAGCSEPEIPYVEVTVSDEVFEDKFYYGLLEEEDIITYKEIYQGLINHQEEIYIHGEDWENAYRIFDYILYDFPALFWVDGGAESSTYDGYTILEPIYVTTLEEREKRQAEIEQEVSAIINQIPAEYTEYEKVKYVYEYLVNSIDYVDDAPDDQNIYSAFVNKETVCAGYARANQYLLNEMDIFCMYVSGTTCYTEEGGDGHAWNIVKVGDNYYVVDVTWADPVESEEETTEGEPVEEPVDEIVFADPMVYDYLCCSQESVADTHFKEEGYPYPECASNDLEYYRLMGRYFEELDKNTLQQIMKDDISNKAEYTEFKFANLELANAARDNIRGEWMQDVANHFCELFDVDEMSYYSEVDEQLNKVTIYWVYE